ITGTLGIVFIVAHYMTMATYVTNLVQLIGLGIAIDYSLLIVYRFREELARGGAKDDAIARTMATAGRAVIFSGATVAIGLALLLFMPVPFMRSMRVGGPRVRAAADARVGAGHPTDAAIRARPEHLARRRRPGRALADASAGRCGGGTIRPRCVGAGRDRSSGARSARRSGGPRRGGGIEWSLRRPEQPLRAGD